MHFSTEKISFPEKKNLTEHENLLANSNSVSVSKTSKSNIRRTSLTLNCSTESENSLMSEDNRVAKSIPFEPYTLPSLDYHQSINHSIQAESAAQTVIKTEPQCPSTFRSERKIDSPDQENCLVKRELEDTRPSQTDMKRRRSSPSPERACNNDANLFAIPFPSARQKRRAKESTITSLNLKVPQESNAKDLTTNVAPESTQSIINNIKKEGTEVSESCLKKQQTNSLNTNPFINKDTQQQNPLSKANDVSKLGEVLERSLMVVEVVSLIRLIQPSNATTLNTTSTGLTNFKRFRKLTNLSQNSIIVSRNENAALPKIIGGCDLIAHSAANSRREEFIASQPSENAIVNQRNEEVDSTNSALDPTFLQPFPNMSRRRRVR